MSRLLTIVLMGISFGAGVGVGVLGLLWATGGNDEPSQDIAQVVPTLSLNVTTMPSANEDLQAIHTKLDALGTQVAVLAAAPVVQMTPSGETAQATATPAPAVETPAPVATEEAAANPAVPARALFRIDQEQSEARFKIDEVLSGSPFQVVGTTRQVAGDIIIDYANPSASQIGQIGINARTLRTDNEFRDQAIRGRILQSSQDEFEFITFTPTQLTGLPTAPVNVGDTVNFQVQGDLLIRGVIRNVTFDVTLTATSLEQITGLATTTVLYADFGLTINAPPTVSNIGDTVTLEFEFVANQVEEAS